MNSFHILNWGEWGEYHLFIGSEFEGKKILDRIRPFTPFIRPFTPFIRPFMHLFTSFIHFPFTPFIPSIHFPIHPIHLFTHPFTSPIHSLINGKRFIYILNLWIELIIIHRFIGFHFIYWVAYRMWVAYSMWAVDYCNVIGWIVYRMWVAYRIYWVVHFILIDINSARS